MNFRDGSQDVAEVGLRVRCHGVNILAISVRMCEIDLKRWLRCARESPGGCGVRTIPTAAAGKCFPAAASGLGDRAQPVVAQGSGGAAPAQGCCVSQRKSGTDGKGAGSASWRRRSHFRSGSGSRSGTGSGSGVAGRWLSGRAGPGSLWGSWSTIWFGQMGGSQSGCSLA